MRNAKVIDWKDSIIKRKLDQGNLEFNYDKNPKFFKEDEIEYMINVLKYSSKTFSSIDLLTPLFNKALNTLERLMDELMIGHIFDRI